MPSVTCPSCHCETTVEPSWNYCTKCGGRLTSGKSSEAAIPASRTASMRDTGTSGVQRRNELPPLSSGTSTAGPKPGKVYIFFVIMAFCLVGAVVGGLVQLFLGIKGAEIVTMGIPAGAAMGYEFLRRRGAFPARKKPI